MIELSRLMQLFPGKIVKKERVRDCGFPRLPQFIVEYLIANVIDESMYHEHLASTKAKFAEIFPSPETRGRLLNQLRREKTITVVDKVKAQVNVKTGKLVASLEYLGENNAGILEATVEKYPRILTDGMWGAYRIGYDEDWSKTGQVTHRIVVGGCAPFQTNVPKMSEFLFGCLALTGQEWVDLLLASVGYEPSRLSPREKILLTLRLIPAVEPNVNILELGPRQTGKTYLLRNISPSVYTASGANVSAAGLFINVATGNVGILGSYKIVQLDEIAHTKFDDVSTVSMLKDYMESGQFARGGRSFATDASILLAGNIDVEGREPSKHYKHLFEPLPKQLQDTAFLDRVHAYIPGWEIGKIRPSTISQGYGLVVDYLGQVLMQLRNWDRRSAVHEIDLPNGMTKRDVVAVERITSGLLKLVYPHDQYTTDQLVELVNIALEMRQRVNNELARMAPGEFQMKHLHVNAPAPVVATVSATEPVAPVRVPPRGPKDLASWKKDNESEWSKWSQGIPAPELGVKY